MMASAVLRHRGRLCSVFLAVASLLTAGCELVSRSGLRKLQSYEPDRLAALDLGKMRIAFQHDARVHLDLDATGIDYRVVGDGLAPQSRRFAPRLVAEAPQLPGVPPARKGQTWTEIAIKESDVSAALKLARVELVGLDVARKASKQDRVVSWTQDQVNVALENLRAVFPALLPASSDAKEYRFRLAPTLHFDFSPSLEASRKRFRLEVWLLLDPRDGFFQIINGPVALDGGEKRTFAFGTRSELAITMSPGESDERRSVNSHAVDPVFFRAAVKHDHRVAVDLDKTGFVAMLNSGDTRRKRELHRFAPVIVTPRTSSIIGLRQAESGFEWTLLALHENDVAPLRTLMKLLLDVYSKPKGASRIELSVSRKEFGEALKEIFPDASSSIDELGELG
ncbi:MAG: hypothetical protein ACREA0_20070, partial [bacterium]